MKDGGQYIVLSADELKRLIEQAVARGIRSAGKPMLSRSHLQFEPKPEGVRGH